jgi:hypothetical protein
MRATWAMAAAAAAVAGAAQAAPKPADVNPLFLDPPPKEGAKPAPPVATHCPVRITEVSDARRAPETLGIVAGRPVRAPEDRTAWVRSMTDALGPRGFDVTYGDTGPGLPVQVRLTTAWVTAVSTNKTANLVLHARIARPDAEPIERDYRGDLTNLNWNSTDTELKHLVDRVIAEALDHMAADLAPLCGQPQP